MNRIVITVLAATIALAAGCARDTRGTLFPREPEIRVRLVHTLPAVNATLDKPWRITTPAQSLLLPSGTAIRIEAQPGGIAIHGDTEGQPIIETPAATLEPTEREATIQIQDVPYGVGWWWESTETRTYQGRLEINVTDDGQLLLVLALPSEEYLRGVVPSEIGTTAPEEALKAQAIAARSETMTALTERTYAGEHYDICADVDCQVFSGLGKSNEATDAAIIATRGTILAWDGKPIPAYYASNCGGHSEDIRNVWPKRDRGIPCWQGSSDTDEQTPDLTDEQNVRQWIQTEPDVYCNPAVHTELPEWTRKNFRWNTGTTAEKLTELVNSQKEIGRILSIQPLERGPSGRLKEVRFIGEDGNVTVGPELAIRKIWQPPLKSSCFVVDAAGPQGRPDTFLITGAGYGHGVGMCQTGAMARAAAGQTCDQILQQYYTGAELLPAYK